MHPFEATVRRYIESAVRWIHNKGVLGPNGLDAVETIDLLSKRMIAALGAGPLSEMERAEIRGAKIIADDLVGSRTHQGIQGQQAILGLLKIINRLTEVR
jgi:hypothetical protein